MNPKMHAHPSNRLDLAHCCMCIQSSCVHLLWVQFSLPPWRQNEIRCTRKRLMKRPQKKSFFFCTCILLSNISRTLRSCPHGWRHRHVLGALLCWAVKRPETTTATATTVSATTAIGTTTNGLNGAFFGQGLEQWPKRFTDREKEREERGQQQYLQCSERATTQQTSFDMVIYSVGKCAHNSRI